jgi:cell fate (sporulation/competence/biofilm development) regulator YlbF (YheA/YmcA/DUF963 family)
MNEQNELMDFVWLLNAAVNSSFEAKELYLEFLRRRQDFGGIRQSLAAGSPQGVYLEQEIARDLESFEGLQQSLQEVIGVLRLNGRGCGGDER